MLKDFANLFRIKKNERGISLVFLLLILFFQYLIISKFFFLFADYSDHNWDVFMRNFHMSGYDPITYSVVTNWHQGYDIIRHPLLAFMMYPFYLLNQVLWTVTSVNCCQILVSALLTFCAYYSFIFLHRVLTEIVEINNLSASLLSFFFFGFAYIFVTFLVPDHFAISLFLLLITIYITGLKIKKGKSFSIAESLFLFSLTAGVTLSNGVVIGILIFFVNGKKCLKPKFFLLSIILPSIILLGSGIGIKNYLGEETSVVNQQMSWVSDSANKVDIVVENFLGESIQLHRKYILGDVLVTRPIIVKYSWKAQYVVEAIILLFFIAGIYIGKQKRFLWAVLSILGFNILLHIIIGFAIDEVYIMTAHWGFVIPIAIAYLFTKSNRAVFVSIFFVVLLLTCYLWTYHGYLLFKYLTWTVKG